MDDKMLIHKKLTDINVPFAAPEFGHEEMEEIAAVIKSGWLTTASRCAEFESSFSKYVGAKSYIPHFG